MIDEQGRPEPPDAADERATALGFLDFLRATLAWKCSGVDGPGMAATIGASEMSLGGLLKHMAWVEDHWFSCRLHGNDAAPPWDAVDWEADRDWEWHSAADDTPEELLALWNASVERSRQLVDRALADADGPADGLDRLAVGFPPDADRVPSLRWIVLHMIEEYARHCGHADLLREAVDGSTGE